MTQKVLSEMTVGSVFLLVGYTGFVGSFSVLKHKTTREKIVVIFGRVISKPVLGDLREISS
jgi:uncharacterized membrane protein YsdA (DUF1294 family)